MLSSHGCRAAYIIGVTLVVVACNAPASKEVPTPLTPAQNAWLATHGHRLNTVVAGQGFEDLE